MFKFDLMTPEIKQALKQSIILLVSRSKRSEDHYLYLEEVVSRLRDPKLLKVKNKELVI